MKPVVIYRRVSTSEQGKSGLGLDAQASTIGRFCAAESFEVVASPLSSPAVSSPSYLR